METFKIGICEPEDFSEKAIEVLKSIGEVVLYKNGNLSDFIKDKDAIFVRLRYDITDEIIGKDSKLRFICSPTTGLNHVNVQNSKVRVVSLKGEYEFLSSIRATPEHVFGLSIALMRNYAHAFLNKDNLIWNRNLYKGFELFHSNVGIIGMGRVGKIIASYYQAFEATVRYVDVIDVVAPGCQRCESVEELIEKSDIIILAANYTIENHEMLNREHFDMMEGKYFINAARGELVDEASLIEKLKEGHFKGVAIDVLQDEANGYPNLSKLLELTEERNLIITPHIGGATYTSMMRTEEFIADKLYNILKND